MAVIGCGAVGLNAVQGAMLEQAEKIVAIDVDTARLAMARTFGATHIVDARANDVVAQVTGASDWRIADLVDGTRPASLYLVVPPSDISRTKPLIRLILNQIGRRLTEELTPNGNRTPEA